ncbi:SIR2 family protein [Pseudomonas putida]|uniref:SIR2 family protein n=1 Tax=Pseudomonas putida TaxID=303 RepID=UPI0018C867BE|nr:SIR2 family protein [Pseudomonas putida]
MGDLARQRVVLFLGAGVSASAITASGQRIAGWPKFLRDCAQRTDDPLRAQLVRLLDGKDYLLACELLQHHFGDDWGDIVTAEFGQQATPSPLHAALLGLRQRIIITTNFDKLIETAWANFTDGGTHLPKVISGVDQQVFRVLKDHEGKYLLKIHGTFDDARSLIFSRSEYIRLAFGNENYSNFLEALLLNFTFIYVGFSMDDPAITSLMEMYTLRYPTSRPHYIFTPQGIEENIVEVHKRLRKLVVIQYDSKDNHAALAPLIEDLGRQARARYRTLVSDMMNFVENEPDNESLEVPEPVLGEATLDNATQFEANATGS